MSVEIASMTAKAWLTPLAMLMMAALSAPHVSAQAKSKPPVIVWAVTIDHKLIKVNARQPDKLLRSRTLNGVPKGDRIAGIDYRVAKGVMYALTEGGRLFTLDTKSARLLPVGGAPVAAVAAAASSGRKFGFDFNPTVDRIRVVSVSGENFRIHPDTGAQIDGDAAADGVQQDARLRYAEGDRSFGKSPQIVAAAYTYNKTDEKLTSNYALDRAAGTLVLQGSREGATPVVSPNTGLLTTVGSLGLGRFTDASFDISDIDNTALAAIRVVAKDATGLYRIDLATGKATRIGTLAGGARVLALAIEP